MKRVPGSIEKCKSVLSASEKIFYESTNYYKQRLKNSGENFKNKKAHNDRDIYIYIYIYI